METKYCLNLIFFITGLIFISGCNNQNIENINSIADKKADSVEILGLLQQMYKWHETQSSRKEFVPCKKNPDDKFYWTT